MSFLRNARILLICTALLIGGAVWVASQIQRATADDGRARHADAQSLLTGMLDMETGLRGFEITRSSDFLRPYTAGLAGYDRALVSLQGQAGGETAGDLARLDRLARRWRRLASAVIAGVRSRGAKAISVAGVRRGKAIFDRFRATQAQLAQHLDRARRDSAGSAGLITAGVSLALALLIGFLGDLVLGRRDRAERARREADARYRQTQSEFSETMQLAESEAEAHDLLRRHVERAVPGSRVVVLNRNDGADRLDPVTRVEDPDLAQRLHGAQPRSCLAVRLGRPSERTVGDDPLLSCEICGAGPENTTCQPVVIGSQVIGSVLVTHHAALEPAERAHLRDSITQAAPALANLRNLALAETRAATDALTGLPNRRAIEDTLKRMIAQASRTMRPLSALMIDLDHFKTINDLYGHELGDQALAGFGVLLSDSLRDSDFAGRQGGEEFIVLAPATDAEGAATLAENLRAATASLKIPGLDHTLTTSIGVATFPDVASSATALVRMADRALYAAKKGGRDRFEVASPLPRRPAADSPATS